MAAHHHRRHQPPPRQRSPQAPPARRPGGQPGNTNAVRHGLYSRHLATGALQALQEAQALAPADLSQEVALARAHLAQLVAADGITADAVRLGLEIVTRVSSRHHRQSPRATADLAQHLTAVLNSLGDQLLPPDP